MVALAHDVFNMGTNETWDYNERERHLHDLARPKQGRAGARLDGVAAV